MERVDDLLTDLFPGGLLQCSRIEIQLRLVSLDQLFWLFYRISLIIHQDDISVLIEERVHDSLHQNQFPAVAIPDLSRRDTKHKRLFLPQFFPLIPYPGTEAYTWAKENGYITGTYDDYCKEDGTLNCVISTPELTSEELVSFCAAARKKYYLRPWYIMHRLAMGLRDPEDMRRSLKAFGRLKKSLFSKN